MAKSDTSLQTTPSLTRITARMAWKVLVLAHNRSLEISIAIHVPPHLPPGEDTNLYLHWHGSHNHILDRLPVEHRLSLHTYLHGVDRLGR
jgi:hypothetical protein